MTATPARLAALEAMRGVRRGRLLDAVMGPILARAEPRDRPWIHELVYGTIRLRGRLDHALAPRVRRGLDRLDPDVLDVLRLGAYQLLEMGGVPAYAAVSQSVELAKAAARQGAGGLVNGVLQRLGRERGALEYPTPDRDPVGHLTTWGSHPRWMVERWIERYGVPEAAALVEANLRRPDLYLRPIGVPAAEARSRLEAVGIGAEPVPFSPDSLKVTPPVAAEAALAAVPAVVQDPAAALVVRYAAAPEGGLAVDLCAAPGGKTLGLAERAGFVLGVDVSAARLALARENVERVRARVGLAVADARRPPVRDADAVLLDVPCTGTGTLRRHPDAKWRLRPADLGPLARLQRELLDAAAGIVAAGGLLVYATCSLEPEENEDQVDGFLERHPGFEPEPTPAALAPELTDAAGRLAVLPQRQGVDGAFAARLRRRT